MDCSQISGARLMAFWRNELGFLDCRYSNDYGETWIDQACLPMTYQPGKVVQHLEMPLYLDYEIYALDLRLELLVVRC